jgi:hypothetical protein
MKRATGLDLEARIYGDALTPRARPDLGATEALARELNPTGTVLTTASWVGLVRHYRCSTGGDPRSHGRYLACPLGQPRDGAVGTVPQLQSDDGFLL